jgi:hypothetical protein
LLDECRRLGWRPTPQEAEATRNFIDSNNDGALPKRNRNSLCSNLIGCNTMAGDIDLSEMRFAMGEATKWSQQNSNVSPVQARSRLPGLPKVSNTAARPLTSRTLQRNIDLLAAQPAHIRGVIQLDSMMSSRRMRAQGDHPLLTEFNLPIYRQTFHTKHSSMFRPTQGYNKESCFEATASSKKWGHGGDKSKIW